jgi:hypothetical protein
MMGHAERIVIEQMLDGTWVEPATPEPAPEPEE